MVADYCLKRGLLDRNPQGCQPPTPTASYRNTKRCVEQTLSSNPERQWRSLHVNVCRRQYAPGKQHMCTYCRWTTSSTTLKHGKPYRVLVFACDSYLQGSWVVQEFLHPQCAQKQKRHQKQHNKAWNLRPQTKWQLLARRFSNSGHTGIIKFREYAPMGQLHASQKPRSGCVRCGLQLHLRKKFQDLGWKRRSQ